LGNKFQNEYLKEREGKLFDSHCSLPAASSTSSSASGVVFLTGPSESSGVGRHSGFCPTPTGRGRTQEERHRGPRGRDGTV